MFSISTNASIRLGNSFRTIVLLGVGLPDGVFSQAICSHLRNSVFAVASSSLLLSLELQFAYSPLSFRTDEHGPRQNRQDGSTLCEGSSRWREGSLSPPFACERTSGLVLGTT